MNDEIIRAFHPGYYLREYIEELQMTQDEFAKRLGISGKQVSLILQEKASITIDVANKLSKLLDSSIELWINLQLNYDKYLLQLEEEKLIEEEKIIYKMIDKKFLVDIGVINKKENINEGILKLRKASMVSSLTLHKNKDIYCFYRTSIMKEDSLENIVCKNVWVSIALSLAKQVETQKFNENKILKKIEEFRKMTLENPNVFYPKLKRVLSECGVALVILPALKNSNIGGAIKWIDKDKVMMALNTRGAYNDKFWFSFFHELKHVLQQIKRKVLINSDFNMDYIYEYEADIFAKETLIKSELLNKLTVYDENTIKEFANMNNIHPGIVVGRLQKEGIIKYSEYNYLKEKYDTFVFKCD